MMTAANIVTLIRIALIPIFMFLMGMDSQTADIAALVVFIVASLTDGIDGYLARKMNQITNFGKIIDPLADKLLVTAAILYFIAAGQMPAWAAMIILAREFLVSSLRTVASAEGVVIAAGWSGKVKTLVQIICIVFMLTELHALKLGSLEFTAGDIAVYAMVIVTVWSGIDYIVRHKSIIQETVQVKR